MGLALHVYRRGGIYWWRRRGAPDCEGRAQYLHLSLKVRSPKAARIMGIRVTAEAERIASLVGAGMLNSDQQKALLAKFIKEQIENLDNEAVKFTARAIPEWSEIDERVQDEKELSVIYSALAAGGASARISDNDQDRLLANGFNEQEVNSIRHDLAMFSKAYPNFGEDFDPERTSVSPNYGYFAETLQRAGMPVSEQTIEQARRQWLRARSKVLKDTNRRYGVDNANADDIYMAMVAQANSFSIPLPDQPSAPMDKVEQQSAPSALQSPPFHELLKNLVMARRKSGEWDQKTEKQHLAAAELFLKYIGTKEPTSITQRQVGGFRAMLDRLPKVHGKSSRDRLLPLKAILDNAESLPPDKVGLSPNTINRYLTQLGTILKYARTQGFDVADFDVSTIKDMRPRDIEADEDKRLAFTADDLETLFRHPVWTAQEQQSQPSLYWVPVLGLYGLGRLSELCGLMVADIDVDPTHPALLIRGNASRRVKNRTSVRRIPLHSEIMRLGFLDYVAKTRASGETLLFPDLSERGNKTELSSLFGKKWTPVLDKALPEARQETKTFHSFRKTGNTAMINGEVIDAIRLEIMGHTQQSVNTRHYKGSVSDEAKLRALAYIPVATAHLTRMKW